MRTIEQIATSIAEGLEPWLGHVRACSCLLNPSITGHRLGLYDATLHDPMCGVCSCGLRDALMAEAIDAATDDEVLAYVKANGEDVGVLAHHVREVLRLAWQGFKDR